MGVANRPGPDFTRLWAAYTVSTVGSAVATDAFVLIAVLVLAGSPLQVSLLSALAGAVGALLAFPLGPWIEFRHKRPLMIGADLVRCAAVLTVPIAHVAGALTYVHLAVVAVFVALGRIVFVSASGAYLKTLVAREHLREANGRFESVLWTSSAVGPPVGGLLIAVLGPATTVLVDAVSYLLSALGLRSIAGREADPPSRGNGRHRGREIVAGWRYIFADGGLRILFLNTVSVSALIIAMAPILAVMMLRELHFSPFQYGLSVGIPCIAGILGARFSRRLVHRESRSVLLAAGIARVAWLPLLPLMGSGWLGLALVTAVHTGTVFFMAVFNPVFATYRLERTPDDGLARVLTAWSIGNHAARAACTIAWGLLATVTSPRVAISVAVVALLGTVVFLPWRHDPASVDRTDV
ncbi:MFS transporter [Thermomonospora umbrina]|uniref:Putative MFS family arabinose efflux permease n=1 Tax=Thermomonospora umbrina TaxID=111806 RepID=A0A3D9SLN2_9ACTN|nr:MFS transporter [Thermomonospora umbrina]REE96832.1 putative MFS family arabinose efflux permease [Thermomonospora umbrina]